MKPTVIALHGFLGQGSDWDAVRAASKANVRWVCPDLFCRGASSFAPPDVEGPCWLAGYSFGARLALRWMQDEPERWSGALLISANPGNFQGDDERVVRRKSDDDWAAAFCAEAWEAVMQRWNAQAVFAGNAGQTRSENDFDREMLTTAMRDFSVAEQFTDPLRLPPRLVWLAGGRDTKFCGLLDAMRNAGFPGSFLKVENAGHRLLRDAPEAAAAALDQLTDRADSIHNVQEIRPPA